MVGSFVKQMPAVKSEGIMDDKSGESPEGEDVTGVTG